MYKRLVLAKFPVSREKFGEQGKTSLYFFAKKGKIKQSTQEKNLFRFDRHKGVRPIFRVDDFVANRKKKTISGKG